MSEEPMANNKSLIAAAAVVLLFIFAKAYLIFLNPVAPLDSTWSLSSTFSILNNSPLFNTFTEQNTFSLYGYLVLPFFYFFKGKYVLFIFYEGIRLILCYHIYRLLSNAGKRLFVPLIFALLFLLDKELSTLRPELLLGTIIFLFHKWCLQRKRDYFLFALLMFVLLFTAHPVAGLAHALFYIFLNVKSTDDARKHLTIKKILLVVVTLAFSLVYTFYSPFGVAQMEMAAYRVSAFSLSHFAYFLKMSFPLYLGLLFYRSMHKGLLHYLIITSLFILLFSYIGGHYYFIYLLLYTVLDISIQPKNNLQLGRNFKGLVFGSMFFVSAYLSIGHFIYIYSESPTYLPTIQKVFTEVEKYTDPASQADLYIDNYFSMPLLKNSNTRMLWHGEPFWGKEVGELQVGDILLVTTQDEFQNLKESRHYDRLEVETVVPPTEGVLSLTYKYRKRVNQYGLWKCVVVK